MRVYGLIGWVLLCCSALAAQDDYSKLGVKYRPRTEILLPSIVCDRGSGATLREKAAGCVDEATPWKRHLDVDFDRVPDEVQTLVAQLRELLKQPDNRLRAFAVKTISDARRDAREPGTNSQMSPLELRAYAQELHFMTPEGLPWDWTAIGRNFEVRELKGLLLELANRLVRAAQ